MSRHSILAYIGPADFVTTAGLVLGISSIFASLHGHFAAASTLIIASALCDYFDGAVARALHTAGEFGAALDGFNDFLTYLVSIAVFGYAAGLTSPLALALFALFITGGTLRLARYSVLGVVDGYYVGLPVSFSLLILPVFCFLRWQQLPVEWLLPIYGVLPPLMVSTLRVKKPGA